MITLRMVQLTIVSLMIVHSSKNLYAYRFLVHGLKSFCLNSADTLKVCAFMFKQFTKQAIALFAYDLMN